MLNRLSNPEEIDRVIRLGIKRPIPDEKINISYGDFSPMVQLLESLQIDSRAFSEKLKLRELLALANETLEKLIQQLEANAQHTLINGTFDYLSESDVLKPADAIFVFGSKNLDRPRKAAELFLASYAPFIYFSGSHPLEESNREHEGRQFKKFVMDEYKIPEEFLIADPNDNSLTMVDNVRGFLNYVDENNIKLRSVIAVCTAHNLRRGWCLFKKYTPDSFEIIRQSSGQRHMTEKNNWFRNPTGTRLIFEEYLKIRIQQLTQTS